MRHEGAVVLLAFVLSMHAATGHAVTAPSHLAPGTRNVQLPPEVMVDRHLVRMERLLADDEPGAALEAMNEILALHEEHSLALDDDFHFHYARAAFAAGRTQTAIASLNEYLAATAPGTWAGQVTGPDAWRRGIPGGDVYRVGVKFEKQGHVKGTINYWDDTTATLIVLKTAMIQGLSLLVGCERV